MDSTDIGPKRHLLPRVKDVDCEIVSWAPSEADVDLSIACMFEREMPGAHLAGGLLQLDEALGGALTRLREEGYFRAQEMETFLVQTPPQLVRARRVLLNRSGQSAYLEFRNPGAGSACRGPRSRSPWSNDSRVRPQPSRRRAKGCGIPQGGSCNGARDVKRPVSVSVRCWPGVLGWVEPR
jgi:hypothetical protein